MLSCFFILGILEKDTIRMSLSTRCEENALWVLLAHGVSAGARDWHHRFMYLSDDSGVVCVCGHVRGAHGLNNALAPSSVGGEKWYIACKLEEMFEITWGQMGRGLEVEWLPWGHTAHWKQGNNYRAGLSSSSCRVWHHLHKVDACQHVALCLGTGSLTQVSWSTQALGACCSGGSHQHLWLPSTEVWQRNESFHFISL